MPVTGQELRFLFMIENSEAVARAVAEHLAFVRARNNLRRRWMTSFEERTKLIINFVFNFANQEIARQAQKENSSMMT